MLGELASRVINYPSHYAFRIPRQFGRQDSFEQDLEISVVKHSDDESSSKYQLLLRYQTCYERADYGTNIMACKVLYSSLGLRLTSQHGNRA
ncbi:hypothetical protein Moror_1143 [Moniliophthora roreri MCA 2997]|uniref:Uncharacterized protein n=1 Tax=Moniliophthora roreri (strain MCA 2997) TaxID=1381753 RepID=V2XFB6_MONRO|nr:hypothetical protein Moror_1143 [Moniliophthora roreri MCA 2997]